MSWRKRAPWHNGGKGWNKSGKSNQKPYDVCADCGHWEYQSHGNFCCSLFGGEHLGDAPRGHDAGRGNGVRDAAAAGERGDGPDAELRAAAALLLAAKPLSLIHISEPTRPEPI
eukprot:9478916-Pyramimonas_sp.AAC.1